MVKKHREIILNTISEVKLKSTSEILREVENKVKKKINWSDLYRTLRDLADKGLIKVWRTAGGFYWIKKQEPDLF